MSSGFLDILDAILATGIDGFSADFRASQIAFVLEKQQPDGGFPGRRGVSDLYYTDFALRLLTLLQYEGPAISHVGTYLSSLREPTDVVTLFNYLHAARLSGVALPGDNARRVLARGNAISAYRTFLAALCSEILGDDMPRVPQSEILRLQCPDGGFSDTPGETQGQTNATAAAVAVLRLHESLDEATAARACRFLAQMQGEDGGLRAHATAGESDLLSTFTGLLTLLGMDIATDINLAAIARFTRALACPTGGFRACPSDDEPDIEYAYYGMATLALLRAHVVALAG